MTRRLHKGGCLAGAAALLCAAAPLPGIGPLDPRIQVDASHLPWSAVGLLLIPRVSRCTAVAIAPHWIATAAHCLYHRALARIAPASSIHIVFGYRSGDYARLVAPDEIRLLPGADPASPGLRGSDAALLHVPDTLTALLPPTTASPGTQVALGGFEQDRAERLVIDPACTVLGLVQATDHQPLLQHGCNGTRGVSGGALVVQTGPGTWGLAGMAVAAQTGQAGGYAIPGDRLRALLP